MKALNPWEKRVLRAMSKRIEIVLILVFGAMFAISFAALLEASLIYGNIEGARRVAEMVRHSHLMQCLLLDYDIYIIFGSSFSLILSLYILCLSGTLGGSRELLPEISEQNAKKILEEHPEFSDILNLLVRVAMVTDDGRELAEKIKAIRDLIDLQENLKDLTKDVADLRARIAKDEAKLR